MMTTRCARLVCPAAVLGALLLADPLPGLLARQIPPLGGEAAYTADLAARRARAMAAFEGDTVVVLTSAPPRVYSTDTNYEYRQESHLLYLTGLTDERLTLVLVPGASGPREFLFIPEIDPTRELWEGRGLRVNEAQRQSGIAEVYTQRGREALEAFLGALFDGSAPDVPRPGAERMAVPRVAVSKVAALDAARRIAASAATDDHRSASVQDLWAGRSNVTTVDAAPVLERLRQLKTPYEQLVLRKSVEISADAHIAGMRATKPGRWEYEVEAAIEHWFLKSGALSPGYPSIVASGPNATTLHYLKSTRQMQAGDLLLVDAAGNFQGLTGDITRTSPVSGRFSPAQRALYDAVSTALDAGIAAARPGGTVQAIEQAVRASLGRSLLDLGLVTEPSAATGESRQIRYWFPHGAVHGIGVDVHDYVGRLDAGAAFVIEPGLYIRRDTLERLERDPATTEFAKTITPAVTRFLDMGIRLEDSFLMTTGGPENLSRRVPRTIAAVEQIVGRD